MPRDAVMDTRIFGYKPNLVSDLNDVINDTQGGKYFVDTEVG